MMKILAPAITPTGKPGLLIECTCATHRAGNTRAIVPATFRAGMEANPDLIHGHVMLARHPLAIKRGTGPWVA